MGVLVLLMLLEVWPACPAEGWVTSEYGYRKHPITGKRAKHAGIDMANREGTEIHAPWRGHVLRVRKSRVAGLHVVILSGNITLTLAHLSSVRVCEGDTLARGDLVGLMGHTGRVTGNHLHLEIRHEDRTTDPAFAFLTCPVLP